ncbi:hypothetical protein ETQ85_00595 [Zoogloea oleivorans]|uniref:Peptidase M41 domain-containing protein n=1 Tax=Zoogloea oleivorans TaxID=1552750 RepID=A0A6C2D858_9RHOO|nr:hypothetical protein [Zoogloea oleivorans]TYC62091.1 hypothetical protein ETQ85_00595 [Zoogloea oleivorans]
MMRQIEYPFPRDDEVRRVWPFALVPEEIKTSSLALTAYHEAGHVVLLEWVGFDVKQAVAAKGEGATLFDRPSERATAVGIVSPNEAHHAGAAALAHAGICAELIYAGAPWQGVTKRNDSDWQLAHDMLFPIFGGSSAGHGYAQRVALSVLTQNWGRVVQIAGELMKSGSWKPPCS